MLWFALPTGGLTAAFSTIMTLAYSTGKQAETFLQPCKAGNEKARQFKTRVIATSL